MKRTNQYFISSGNGYIYIHRPNNGDTYFTNYDKDFYNLLNSEVIRYGYDNAGGKTPYLGFCVSVGCQNIRAYFHHIVYCFYNRGLNEDNAVAVLQAFRKEVEDGNLCIDHLDDNQKNNCIFNLSLVTTSENAEKISRSSLMKNICRVDSAFCKGKYITEITYLNVKEDGTTYLDNLYTVCSSMNEYNTLLRDLKRSTACFRGVTRNIVYDTSGACNTLNSGSTCVVRDNNEFYRSRIEYDADIQKLLLRKDFEIINTNTALDLLSELCYNLDRSSCCQ